MLVGKRDRELLSLGFAGAFRRSKMDQEGQGQEVAIPRGYRLRPVEAM